jgi:hypothetical protein
LLSIMGSILTYRHAIGGKSAILTALVVGLGGKATSTGRGSGTASLIREGQRYSFLVAVFIRSTKPFL